MQPRWEAKEFPKDPVKNSLPLLVSGNKDDCKKGALFIHQDTQIFGGNLNKETDINHSIKHQVYILVSKGKVKIKDEILKKGDGDKINAL